MKAPKQPDRVELHLPEPPSPNRSTGRHWVGRWGRATQTKQRTWLAAIRQVRPFHNPHDRVRVRAHFRLHNLRDEDNLVASLKPVLDALKHKHGARDQLAWKKGLFVERGYFVDDDPGRLHLEPVTQEIKRHDRGLTLVIERMT